LSLPPLNPEDEDNVPEDWESYIPQKPKKERSTMFVEESLFDGVPATERRRFEWGFVTKALESYANLENDPVIQALTSTQSSPLRITGVYIPTDSPESQTDSPQMDETPAESRSEPRDPPPPEEDPADWADIEKDLLTPDEAEMREIEAAADGDYSAHECMNPHAAVTNPKDMG
jgi:hypothetical protein